MYYGSLMLLFLHFLSPAGENSRLGSQAQLRPRLPPPWCPGGRGLCQLLHPLHRLLAAVSRAHQLPAHVATLVQSPLLQRLHHVGRFGPGTLRNQEITRPTIRFSCVILISFLLQHCRSDSIRQRECELPPAPKGWW